MMKMKLFIIVIVNIEGFIVSIEVWADILPIFTIDRWDSTFEMIGLEMIFIIIQFINNLISLLLLFIFY